MALRSSLHQKSINKKDGVNQDLRLSRGGALIQNDEKNRQNTINSILQNYGQRPYDQIQRDSQYDPLYNPNYNTYNPGNSYVDQILQQSRQNRIQAENRLNYQDQLYDNGNLYEQQEREKRTGKKSIVGNLLNRTSQAGKDDLVKQLLKNTEYDPYYNLPVQTQVPLITPSLNQDRYAEIISSYERQIRELNDQLRDWNFQLNLKDKTISELQSDIQSSNLANRDKDNIIQQLKEDNYQKEQIIAQLYNQQQQQQPNNSVDHNLYKSQIDQRDQKIHDLQEENSRLNLNIDNLQNACNNAMRDNKQLQEKFQKLNVKGAWCC